MTATNKTYMDPLIAIIKRVLNTDLWAMDIITDEGMTYSDAHDAFVNSIVYSIRLRAKEFDEQVLSEFVRNKVGNKATYYRIEVHLHTADSNTARLVLLDSVDDYCSANDYPIKGLFTNLSLTSLKLFDNKKLTSLCKELKS